MLDAAAAVIPRLRQLLARLQPAPGAAQPQVVEQQPGQQQQKCRSGNGAPAGISTRTPLASKLSTGLAKRGIQQQQQPLLPGRSLVRLQRHATVAGNSSSGVAVLDARPEPWREQQQEADGGLVDMLAGLQQVQLAG
jgi:hypothetical protein